MNHNYYTKNTQSNLEIQSKVEQDFKQLTVQNSTKSISKKQKTPNSNDIISHEFRFLCGTQVVNSAFSENRNSSSANEKFSYDGNEELSIIRNKNNYERERTTTINVKDFCFIDYLEEKNKNDVCVFDFAQTRCRSKTLCTVN